MRSHTYPILYHLVRMTDPLSSATSDQYSIRPSDMSIKEKDADDIVKKNNGMFTIAFSRLHVITSKHSSLYNAIVDQ